MLKIKRMTEVVGRRVYTDSGDYFGDTREGDYDRLGVELRSIEPLISNVYAGEDFRLKYNFLFVLLYSLYLLLLRKSWSFVAVFQGCPLVL